MLTQTLKKPKTSVIPHFSFRKQFLWAFMLWNKGILICEYSLSPREIPRAPPLGFPLCSGYILPYIPPFVIIQIQSKKCFLLLKTETLSQFKLYHDFSHTSINYFKNCWNSLEQTFYSIMFFCRTGDIAKLWLSSLI